MITRENTEGLEWIKTSMLPSPGPQAWDLAVDICLSQLPTIIEEGTAFRHSPFFAEQLTAFQVWLTMGVENRNPPEQLPIVLQVLLSQVHRLRALDLLGRFLDLGPWAVSLALSVGIFPYVLKLLQSSARELRPLLVFIWAKILAVDSSCQADLVKDNGHKYFLSVLADPYMPEACLQGNLIAICLEQLSDPHPLLRQWVAICLGRIWQNFDSARWCGVRDSAHEKLYSLLSDPIPEVRCAAVFALGTFVGNSAERTDHSTTIDHNVAMMLAQLINDGSPVVRKELVVALSHLVVQYESNFCTVALQFMEEEKNYTVPSPANTLEPGNLTPVRDSPAVPRLRSVNSYTNIRAATTARNLNKSLQNLNLNEEGGPVAFSPGNLSTSSSASSTLGSPDNDEYILSFETIDKMRRFLIACHTSPHMSLILQPLEEEERVSFNSVYTQIWRVLLHLAADPFPEVSDLAMKVLNSIAYKALSLSLSPQATMNARPQRILDSGCLTQSAPASPTSKGTHIHQAGGSPPMPSASSSSLTNEVPKPPTRAGDDADDPGGHKAYMNANLSTGLCDWSAKYFAQPVMKIPEEHDAESQVTDSALSPPPLGVTRLDDQIFINRNPGVPSVVKFHPFNPCIAVADKDSICFWDWEKGERLDYFYNGNPRYTRITAMDLNKQAWLTSSDRNTHCSLDDGALRIWKNFADQRNPEMVTAWQGLSDMLPTTRGLARRVSIYLDRSKGQGAELACNVCRREDNTEIGKEERVERKRGEKAFSLSMCLNSRTCAQLVDRVRVPDIDSWVFVNGAGMVVDWEQETGLLMTSGDVRVIRIWDTEREMKVQDIPTGADSCVTSLSCDSQRRVMTYREHSSWVVKAHLQKQTDGKIISVSVDGDVRFFELRSPDSVNVLQTVKGLTALDIHPQANLFACGSMNQFIAVYNSSGDVISNIKYYEGFMGQRIGAISCLAFHPYWPHLAVGSNDYYMSIYSAEKRLR
ncbi:unnamed protein product [Coregonus sp. 'balchen']|nr:unnamed protein product [Coregonus sp. 'balchen']